MPATLGEVDIARDRDLVARYQGGDRSAFDEIYFRYFPLLRRFCERQVGDAHDAEELAQDVFVRALAALPRFAGEQRLYPWLTVIARRLCIDHLRKRGRVRATDDIEMVIADPIEQRIDDQVDMAALQVALARVQERHREVLRLRDWEELSYEDIAKRLEVRVGTAKSLLHRARGALRREFQMATGTLGVAPALLGLLGPLRRLWRRIGLSANGRLPDPGVFAAPIAAMSLTVAATLGIVPQAEPPTVPRPAGVEASATRPAPPAVLGVEPAAPNEPAAPEAAVGSPAPPEPEVLDAAPAPLIDNPPAHVYLGPGGTDEARLRSAQHPVSLDVGPGFLSADLPIIVQDAQEKLLGRAARITNGLELP